MVEVVVVVVVVVVVGVGGRSLLGVNFADLGLSTGASKPRSDPPAVTPCCLILMTGPRVGASHNFVWLCLLRDE